MVMLRSSGWCGRASLHPCGGCPAGVHVGIPHSGIRLMFPHFEIRLRRERGRRKPSSDATVARIFETISVRFFSG